MSLRTRIAAVAGIAVAVAVIGAAVFVYVAVRSQLRGEVDDALRARATPVARPGPPGEPPGEPPGGGPGPPPPRSEPGDPPRGEGRLGPPAEGRALARARQGRPPVPPPGLPPDAGPPPGPRFGGAEGYLQFISPTGSIRRPPGETSSLPVTPGARAIARAGEGEALSDLKVQGAHLRVLAVGAGDRGAVQVARPLDEVDRVLDRVLVTLLVMAILGIAIAALLGALVARTALAPIARFTRRTEALAAAPRSPLSPERMAVAGNDELARLAQSFNTTLDALERSVEAQRQLVADASHELRTPIASLRANVQTLQDADRLSAGERESLRADIVEELDELTALVGDVVELARGAETVETADDVRLDLVVRALVERADRRAASDVSFELELEPTVLSGDPERISRAVSNLLDNASRWSPPGGVVEVALQEGALTVRDHGPGFEERDLPHVFERFYRSESARSTPGSGLGLAIVRQAADAHGGFAQARNAHGGGALLRVGFGTPLDVQEATEIAGLDHVTKP